MMGLRNYAPPQVDLAPATARHRQCGTKIRWPSRWVADNAALLTTWKYPDDEVPLVAYACPWCSVPGDPGFHIGHVFRGDQMKFAVVTKEYRAEVVQWLGKVAPELDPKLVSEDVVVDRAKGNVHLKIFSRDEHGHYVMDDAAQDLETTSKTIVLGPDDPPFPPLPIERAGREGDSQPLPTPNDAPDIQSAVIADIEARRELGIRRYGTALQPHNGRNALQDLYEELLDAACYVKQRLVEDGAA